MRKAATDKIRFHFLTQPFHFTNRTRLKAFLLVQMKREGKSVELLNYIFCNDSYLLNVNQQYLNHDNYTDIIRFEHSPKDNPLISDIYISVERVKENAQLFNTTFTRELHRVIFHGALHLCGYKDKARKQSQQMRSKEEALLTGYFVSRGTAR